MQPNHFALPPEVQQLLRRLAEHAPAAAGAAAGPAGGGEGLGTEPDRGDAEAESAERPGHGPEATEADAPGAGSCGRGGDGGPDVAAPATPAAGSDLSCLPGGVRVKQEAPEPAVSAPCSGTAAASTPPPPSPPPPSRSPLSTPAAVKPDPGSSVGCGGDMEVDEDEVSLARAMVRIRNESELNELAAALFSEPAPAPDRGEQQREEPPDSERHSSQESGRGAERTGSESEPAPGMSYLGHIDSSSELYKSLLELAKHNGNTLMLRVAPDGSAVGTAEREGEGRGEGEEEEPRMSVAEMAAVKMETGDDGEETEDKTDTERRDETTERRDGETERRDEETERRDGETERRYGETERRDGETERRDGETLGADKKTKRTNDTSERTDATKKSEHSEKRSNTGKGTDKTGKTTGDEDHDEIGRKKRAQCENERGTDEGHGTTESQEGKNHSSDRIMKKSKRKKNRKRHGHTESDSQSSAGSAERTGRGGQRGTVSERTAGARRAASPSASEHHRRRTVSELSQDAQLVEELCPEPGGSGAVPQEDGGKRTALPQEDVGERTALSREDGGERTALAQQEEDAVATRTRLDDLGVPIASIQVSPPPQPLQSAHQRPAGGRQFQEHFQTASI